MKVVRKSNSAGCILEEAAFNRLSILMEQIDGMADLLFERLQSEFEKDGAAMAAYNVIQQMAKEADEIAYSGYGDLSAARLREVVKNARDPYGDSANPSMPFHHVKVDRP